MTHSATKTGSKDNLSWTSGSSGSVYQNLQKKGYTVSVCFAALLFVVQLVCFISHNEIAHNAHDDIAGLECHYCIVIDSQAELEQPKPERLLHHGINRSFSLISAIDFISNPRFFTAQSRAPPTV